MAFTSACALCSLMLEAHSDIMLLCLQNVKLAKECVDANLTGFPAWIIGDNKLDGEQTLAKLEAELAGVHSSAGKLAN